jgi:hypothetical protein
MIFSVVVALLLLSIAYAQIPCDDAYGQYCPEESGYGVGECLKKQNLELLTEDCINYIQLHDACKEDINKHCAGKEFTGDALRKQFVIVWQNIAFCTDFLC